MALPYFLMLMVAAIIAAGLTLWLAMAAGLSLAVLGVAALIGAAALHLAARVH